MLLMLGSPYLDLTWPQLPAWVGPYFQYRSSFWLVLVVDLQLTHCVWQLTHAADGLLIDHFVLCVCKQISMWGSVLGQNVSMSGL